MAENNLCKGIKQVLSTNQVLCLTSKNSYASYCPRENTRPKGEKKKLKKMSQKLAQPPPPSMKKK